MPAKVLLRDRAIVIAGLANEVDAVNQFAAPIQADTRQAASFGPGEPTTTRINPAVATASESHCAGPVRICTDAWSKGIPNMPCAKRAPRQQPAIWTIT